jgi:hypothetical protein
VERTQDIERDVKQGLGGARRLKILHLFLWYPDHVFTRARYEIGRTVPNAAVSIRNDLQPLVQLRWVTTSQRHHLSARVAPYRSGLPHALLV